MTQDWVEVSPLGDLLVRAAARAPEAEALVLPDGRTTYGELLERATSVARCLIGMGVGPSEAVGVLMLNSRQFVECLFGIWMAGAVAVPLNARYRAAELAYSIETSGMRVLLTDDVSADHVDHVQRLEDAFPDLRAQANPSGLRLQAAPALRAIVTLGSRSHPGIVAEGAFRQVGRGVTPAEAAAVRARVRVADPALLLFTSGTTAQPRSCLHPHESISRNAAMTGRGRFRLEPADRMWDPLPLFHVGGIVTMVATVEAGATFITAPHFEAQSALATIERERATVAFAAFPTIVKPLLDHPDFARTDVSALRVILAIGPPDFIARVQRELPGAVQVAGYGSTETAGVFAYGDLDDPPERRLVTCGRPFRGMEVRIVDPTTERVLPPGEVGEIRIRGYANPGRYHGGGGESASALDDGGWFRSGDLGTLDGDGAVIYVGRLKDMLKVGGENVAAAEVEAFLAGHPAVGLAAVVGLPDERLEEVPAAFVELNPGFEVTEEELRAYCAGQIASFKVPRVIRFVTEWPMSATKVQKFKLREQLLAELRDGELGR